MTVTSCVKTLNGAQYLFVNDKPVEGVAYITYKRDNNRYEDFSVSGYRLYSVSLFFGSNFLNDTSHIKVFSKGIFDEETPDFEGFDNDIFNILSHCPDAMIFPRVNVSVPSSWEDAHPDELCDTGTDDFPQSKRPCISSDIWANEVKRMLREFVAHIESMPYVNNIVGYQIAGGNTEEWIPHDMKGFIGKRSREAFERSEKDKTDAQYYRFLSEINATRICEFASLIKELTNRRLVVGSFYGYTLELCERRFAHHDLQRLLECDDIDFLCSPLSYAVGRKSGLDHSYMLPVHSVKLHNKLYFAENDTRTHLSKPVNDDPKYNVPIWFGPSKEKSLEILKMHHAKTLLGGHACWWFDMWGGWYDDKDYMNCLSSARELSENSIGSPMGSVSEVAVFVDEKCFAYLGDLPDGHRCCNHVRRSLGLIGTPYDVYLSSDFDKVRDRYKAYIMLLPCKTSLSDKIEAFAKENGKPLCIVDLKTADETPSYFREFCKSSGVFIYCDCDSVVYANESFVFLHTAKAGSYTVRVKNGEKLYDAYTGKLCDNSFYAEIGNSFLFRKG